MYGRDNFIEEFYGKWILRDVAELLAGENFPYISSQMYPYRCDSCELIVQEKSPFCPNCGRAMDDEAALTIADRLNRWWQANEILE